MIATRPDLARDHNLTEKAVEEMYVAVVVVIIGGFRVVYTVGYIIVAARRRRAHLTTVGGVGTQFIDDADLPSELREFAGTMSTRCCRVAWMAGWLASRWSSESTPRLLDYTAETKYGTASFRRSTGYSSARMDGARRRH